MSDFISTSASASTVMIKGGGVLAGTGVIADLVIFTDGSYLYLAIAGSVMSMLGVLHEIFKEDSKGYTKYEIIIEIVKSLFIGLLSVPFFYLSLTNGLLIGAFGLELGKTSNSLSLIVAFGLSWFSVPIFNWVSEFVPNKINKITCLFPKKDKK